MPTGTALPVKRPLRPAFGLVIILSRLWLSFRKARVAARIPRLMRPSALAVRFLPNSMERKHETA